MSPSAQQTPPKISSTAQSAAIGTPIGTTAVKAQRFIAASFEK
jgi:hypothetical protein